MTGRAQAAAHPWPQVTEEEERIMRAVLAGIRQVRYGHLQLVLQDGKVVQIERLEKERLRT